MSNNKKKNPNVYSKSAVKKAINLKKQRNTLRRYLYRTNVYVQKGASRYMEKLSMKQFRRDFEDFQQVYKPKGGLSKQLDRFISEVVRARTDAQCRSSRTNMVKKARAIIAKLNRNQQLEWEEKRYLNILEEGGYITKRRGAYVLLEDKLPALEDFKLVSNRYLRFKRFAISEFGDKEYGEAFGS